MQKGKVVAYALIQLRPHDMKFPTHDLELPAIVHSTRLEELIKDYNIGLNYHPRKANAWVEKCCNNLMVREPYQGLHE